MDQTGTDWALCERRQRIEMFDQLNINVIKSDTIDFVVSLLIVLFSPGTSPREGSSKDMGKI